MPTTVRTLNYASPDAAALSPIALPDATEMAIYANSHIKNWWRADAGFDADNRKWRCRKTDAALIPAKAVFPTQKIILGIIPTIAVTAGGSGYTAATVAVAAPPAGGVQATATATVSGGAVTAITVVNPGSGYLTTPAVTISGDGSGATATAARDADGPYAGHEAIVTAVGAGVNGQLYDGGLNLLPTNADFSVVFVGRQGPSDAGFMWGNGLDVGTAAGSIARGLGQSAGDSMTVRSAGTNLVSTSGTGRYADGPKIDIVSIADSADSLRQTRGAVVQSGSLSNTFHVTNGQFVLFAWGPPEMGLSVANYIEGGDIAELFIVDVALHLAENAALLSTLQTYLAARYAL